MMSIKMTQESGNFLKWYFLVYPQISYSAGSPRLSDKTRYPTVFRLNSDETKFNEGIVALLKHFKWNKVAVVKQDEAMFNDVSENFTEVSEENILVNKRYHRGRKWTINEWGWITCEELWRSRRVLSVEAVGLGG